MLFGGARSPQHPADLSLTPLVTCSRGTSGELGSKEGHRARRSCGSSRRGGGVLAHHWPTEGGGPAGGPLASTRQPAACTTLHLGLVRQEEKWVSESSPPCGGRGRRGPPGPSHVSVTVPSGGGCFSLHWAKPRFSALPQVGPRQQGAGHGVGGRGGSVGRGTKMQAERPTSRSVTGMTSRSGSGSRGSHRALATNGQGNGPHQAPVTPSPDLPATAKCPAARKNSPAERQDTNGGSERWGGRGTRLRHLLAEGQRATPAACTVLRL